MSTKIITGKRNALNNWLRQFRTFIDLENRKFKLQESLFGIFKWGSPYESLPKISYVLVFKSVFVKCEACAVDEFENNPHAYYQVSMVYNKNRRIIVHETQNKEEAFGLAKEISSGLHVKILDSATDRRKQTWLP